MKATLKKLKLKSLRKSFSITVAAGNPAPDEGVEQWRITT